MVHSSWLIQCTVNPRYKNDANRLDKLIGIQVAGLQAGEAGEAGGEDNAV